MKNQRRHSKAVQIAEILKLDTPFISLYLPVHLFGQVSQLQTHKAVVDIFPLKRRHCL